MSEITIRKSDLDDLKLYFNMTTDEVVTSLNNRQDLVKHDIKLYGKEFYKNSKNYIFDLSYWQLNPAKKMFLLLSLQDMVDSKFDTVLDFGSGIGNDSLIMSRFGFDVTMCDYFGELSIYALWRAKRKKEEVGFIDVERIDDVDIQFDCCCCFDVLEHLDDVKDTLKKINKKLKINGRLYLSKQFKDCDKANENKLHLNKNFKYSDEVEFYRLMEDCGFEQVYRHNDEFSIYKKVKEE